MSTALQEPPPGGNQDRGESAAVIVLTMVSISVIMVALRFWARLSIKGLGIDDWFMLASLILFMIVAAIVTKLWKMGGFRHLFYLTTPEQLQVVKFSYLFQVFCVFDFIVAKWAVGFLVLRIMGRDASNPTSTHWRKMLLYGTMGLVAVTGSLDCIFTYVQCSPPRALWEPDIPHTCWNPNVQSNFAIFTAAVNAAADLVLAAVPASIILRLNMDKKKRINLSILLGLGSVAAICGIVKATYLKGLGEHADLTWQTYDLYNWSSAELFVLIVASSVPPLKPHWDRFVVKKRYIYGSEQSRTRSRHKYSNPLSSQGGTTGEAESIELKGNAIITRTDIDIEYQSASAREQDIS